MWEFEHIEGPPHFWSIGNANLTDLNLKGGSGYQAQEMLGGAGRSSGQAARAGYIGGGHLSETGDR